MITVIKEFVFDSAHMLAGHEGLCKNIHGHTYKVLVEVSYRNMHNDETLQEGASKGMTVDFKHLKEALNEALFNKLDHAFIFNSNSDSTIETRIADTVQELGLKAYAMLNRPTAENMCKEFADIVTDTLESQFDRVRLVSLIVYETPTSFAKFTVGG